MDERLKHLVEELSAAVNHALSDSECIAEVIAEIKASGYDVLLFLNATIAIRKREEEPVSYAARTNGRFRSGFNSEDVEFLKSLHISVGK
jgi:hypothetical protein